MSLSYHGRRDALEAGWQALGYRIVVTMETDKTATVFVEDRAGRGTQLTYADYETAMAAWKARLTAVRLND